MSGYAEPWVSVPACALPSVCRRDRQFSMPGMIWKDMGRGESVSYQCFYAWVQIEQSLCHLLDVAPKRWHFSGRIFWNSPSLPTEAFCGFRGLTVMLVCYVGPWMGRIPFSSKTITHLQSVRCPEEGRDNWELHSVALMTRVVICVALREITGIPKLSSVEWALSEYWWGHGIVLKIKPKSPSDENCIPCIMSSI